MLERRSAGSVLVIRRPIELAGVIVIAADANGEGALGVAIWFREVTLHARHPSQTLQMPSIENSFGVLYEDRTPCQNGN